MPRKATQQKRQFAARAKKTAEQKRLFVARAKKTAEQMRLFALRAGNSAKLRFLYVMMAWRKQERQERGGPLAKSSTKDTAGGEPSDRHRAGAA